MKCSDAGLAIIREFEGCRLSAYPDPKTGGAPWTIGFGCTEDVTPGMRITFAEAMDRLKAHLTPLETQIQHLVKVPLNQCQFDALVSLCWNIGIGHFQRSTELLPALNAGDMARAADLILEFDNPGSRVQAGLDRRRAAERALFLKA